MAKPRCTGTSRRSGSLRYYRGKAQTSGDRIGVRSFDRRRRCGTEQAADRVDVALASITGEEACVANAMEAGRQDMDQEMADELGGRQGHDLNPVAALDAVVFPAEGHGVGIGADQAVVRDCDAVRASAEVGQ